MGSALEAAKNQLAKASYGSNKYVLFMTDGMPGYSEGYDNLNCMTANKAFNNAEEIDMKGDINMNGGQIQIMNQLKDLFF